MGTLYLVRHGQASFGAADYDQLSPLGTRQCHALGDYFRSRGVQFGAVLRGTLRRHAQSLAALAEGHGNLPEAVLWPGLNEYDSVAVVRAIHPGPLEAPTTPEAYRHHFRLLREGLARWIAGDTAPEGMPPHAEFVAGVASALAHVLALPPETGHVLLVSSGGPIATAVAHVLGAPRETAIDLNLRIRNSAVTEFTLTPKRLMLSVFNHVPHLDSAERASWVTYT